MPAPEPKRTRRAAADPDDVSVVVRALDILELFERAPGPLPMMAIAQETGLHKATVFRLLSTLVRDQLLRQTEGGEYEIGSFALQRASVVRRSDPHWRAVRRAMEAVRDEVNETVVLTRRLGQDCVDVDFVQATTAVMQAPAIGRRVPLHANTGGSVILAQETPGAIALYVEQRRAMGSGDSEVLEALEAGRRSVAAAIRDEAGALSSALWLSIAPGRAVARQALMEALRRACRDLTISVCE